MFIIQMSDLVDKSKLQTEPTEDMIKCSRCKVKLPQDKYDIKRSGLRYKSCIDCRKRQSDYYVKKQCVHKTFVYYCGICHTKTPKQK